MYTGFAVPGLTTWRRCLALLLYGFQTTRAACAARAVERVKGFEPSTSTLARLFIRLLFAEIVCFVRITMGFNTSKCPGIKIVVMRGIAVCFAMFWALCTFLAPRVLP